MLEAGHAHLLRLALNTGKYFILLNMHIYGLTPAAQHRVAALIRGCTSATTRSVAAKPLPVFSGSLNFHSADHSAHKVVDGQPPRPVPLRPRPQWLAALDALLDLETSHSRTARRPGLAPETMLSTLDFFLDLPTAAIADVIVRTSTVRLPSTHGPLSDHAPVSVTLTSRPPPASAHKPRPRWVYRRVEFASAAKKAMVEIRFKGLHPCDARRRAKQALLGAAAYAHRACLSRPSADPEVIASAAIQAARAVARDNPRSFWKACVAVPSLATFAAPALGGGFAIHDVGFNRHVAELARLLASRTLWPSAHDDAQRRDVGTMATRRDASYQPPLPRRGHPTPLARMAGAPSPPPPEATVDDHGEALRRHWSEAFAAPQVRHSSRTAPPQSRSPRLLSCNGWASMMSACQRLAPHWQRAATLLRLAADEGAMLA